jgi:hypothetical protein
MFQSLFGHLDLALMFVVMAAAVYANDRMVEFMSRDNLITKLVKYSASSDLFWPVSLILLGLITLTLVLCQMVISGLLLYGFGVYLIGKARALART